MDKPKRETPPAGNIWTILGIHGVWEQGLCEQAVGDIIYKGASAYYGRKQTSELLCPEHNHLIKRNTIATITQQVYQGRKQAK